MSNPYAILWGQRIRDRRVARGLSQSELAVACGVTQQTVYCWETGKAAPTDKKKVLVATALGLRPSTLFAYPPANGDEETAA